jgi:hypothetical protein
MDAVPLLVELEHVDLDEGAGELIRFPGRRPVTGLEADDHVADPHRLARLHLELARFAVALVEDAEHRDAILHRRGGGILDRLAVAIDRDHIGRLVRIAAAGDDFVRNRLVRGTAAAARAGTEGEQQPGRSGSGAATDHAPGVQAS